MQNVIVKPIITEKSMANAAAGRFTFLVHRFADKKAIKSAVEKTFNVHVKAVETNIIKGKTKRVGTRRVERVEGPVKKAVVLLQTGEKIDLFELSGE